MEGKFAVVMGYLLAALFVIGVFVGVSSIADAGWLNRVSQKDRGTEALTAKSHGDNLRNTGRPQEAIMAYRNALEIDPQYGDAIQGMGLTYVMMGDYEHGKDWLLNSLKYDPVLPGISYGNLAVIAQQSGDIKTAKYYYRKGIEAAPDPTDHLISLSSMYLELGQPDSLLIQITRASETYGDIKSQYRAVLEFSRRFMAQKSKDTGTIDSLLAHGIDDSLIEHFDVQLFEDFYHKQDRWMAIEHLTGLGLAITGHPAEAIPHLEAALAIQPGNQTIANDLQLARIDAGVK